MLTDRGLLLSFDGVPRSGRTTQANALAALLTEDGHEVVRVTLDHGSTPIAKTDRAWLSEVFARYSDLVEATVVPALERGAIVIADSWVTGALVRAQATMGLPTSECLIYEERALRDAPVDIEWLFPDTAPEQRNYPGFRAAAMSLEDSRCSTINSPFVVVPSLGARRRSLYLVTNGHATKLLPTYAHQANACLVERKSEAWAKVIEQTRADRDMALAVARAAQCEEKARPAIVSLLANWHNFDEATQLAALVALPVGMLVEDLERIPTPTTALEAAVRAKRAEVVAASAKDVVEVATVVAEG
jgi:hypothetical protein